MVLIEFIESLSGEKVILRPYDSKLDSSLVSLVTPASIAFTAPLILATAASALLASDGYDEKIFRQGTSIDYLLSMLWLDFYCRRHFNNLNPNIAGRLDGIAQG
jgi:hypothetical protein